MTAGRAPAPRLVGAEVDTSERLCADDMATRREEENLARAFALQAMRARATAASTPGVCSNCGACCLPHTVYCDAECREDHELRQKRGARLGRGT